MEALLAGLVHPDGLPDLSFAAGLLDEAGGLAEAGKGEGEVLADVGVGVVLAHGRYLYRRGRRDKMEDDVTLPCGGVDTD